MSKIKCVALKIDLHHFISAVESQIALALSEPMCFSDDFNPHVTLGYFYFTDQNLKKWIEFQAELNLNIGDFEFDRIAVFSNQNLVLLPTPGSFSKIISLSKYLKQNLPFKLFQIPKYPHITLSKCIKPHPQLNITFERSLIFNQLNLQLL